MNAAERAKVRLDETRFGPALQFVMLLRGNVAYGPVYTAADVVASVKAEFERLAEVEVAAAAELPEGEESRLIVPALLLYADARWAELVDALLPSAPHDFREEVVATFEHVVVRTGGAMQRYTGSADDSRFGPMLPLVRRMRASVAAGRGPQSAKALVGEFVAAATGYIGGTEEPIRVMRLFADARWPELVDAILPQEPEDFRGLVASMFERQLTTSSGNWIDEYVELRDAMYKVAGKVEHAGGVMFQGFALPSLASGMGATLIGDRIHTTNAQSMARIAVDKMIEENRQARLLEKGAELLQLTGVDPGADPLLELATPAVTAEVMEIVTKHTPPRVMAALALELEQWALERKGMERDLYVRAARDLRAALKDATVDNVEDAEYE